MMLSRVISAGRGGGAGGADDKAASAKRTAPVAITDLCDVYTQNGVEGKWNELLKVYDVRPGYAHLGKLASTLLFGRVYAHVTQQTLRCKVGLTLHMCVSVYLMARSNAAMTTTCARSWH